MYYFIVNPHSRCGRGAKVWKGLEKFIQKEKVEYRVCFTVCPGDGIKIAAELTKRMTEKTVLVVVGGDGTLNEVLNGISFSPYLTLGYIATGSGNDFSRGLGLPGKQKEALELILHPRHYRYLDYGVVAEADGEKINRKFAVSSGIGYDAGICHGLLNGRLKKVLNMLHMGKLVYIVTGIGHILLLKTCDGSLILDGTREIKLKRISFVSFHIQKYEGGGFLFAPDADSMDGLLDLCVVSGISKAGLLWALLCALFNRRKPAKGIARYKCEQAALFVQNSRPVHTDGESCGERNRLLLGCVRQAVRVIVAE